MWNKVEIWILDKPGTQIIKECQVDEGIVFVWSQHDGGNVEKSFVCMGQEEMSTTNSYVNKG